MAIARFRGQRGAIDIMHGECAGCYVKLENNPHGLDSPTALC